MNTFLSKFAQHVIDSHGENLKNITIVFPSKRAGLFFKKSLAPLLKNPIWAPKTITFSDLILDHEPNVILDKTSLTFELFEVYKELPDYDLEPFDQFYKWAELLLNDFNSIDLYLLNSEDVFQDLRNIKELESWAVEELTEMQNRYLLFWNKLHNLYRKFNDRLESKGITSNGKAYKRFALKLLNGKINSFDFDFIYFVGLNALSNSEAEIVNYFEKNKLGTIIWDLDTHYTENLNHEAGHHYRSITNQYPTLKSRKNEANLNTLGTTITTYQADSSIGQAMVTAQILKQLAPIINHEKCAVVLPEASMLKPLLHEIPIEIDDVNITMGYPAVKSDIFTLISQFIALQSNLVKTIKAYKQKKVHHKAILRVLRNPVLKSFFHDEFSDLESIIIKQNKVYVDITLFNGYQSQPLFKSWLSPWSDFHNDGSNSLVALINQLKELQQTKKKLTPFQFEILYHINEAVNRLKSVLLKYPYITKTSTFNKLFTDFVRGNEVSFYGEPLTGLQIMGLLETRGLDFENVIILSCNEGILPQGKPDYSILPFDLKRYHNLPSSYEKDALLSYHFYRLIQRAKNVHLIYAPESDELYGGEKSRFIKQLQHEATNITFSQKKFETPFVSVNNENNIEKDDFYFDKLFQYLQKEGRGLSASALNTFISCPKNFYYKYICGLSEEENVEENIEDSTMGTIVHNTLEELYKPFENEFLSIEILNLLKSKVSNLVNSKFKSTLAIATFMGKNYLAKEMAKSQVLRVIDNDISLLTTGKKIRLIGCEQKLSTPFTINYNGVIKEINLSGEIDRIDELDGTVRIIDYKTGTVIKDDLNLNFGKELHEVKTKAVQLAFYAYLYLTNFHSVVEVESYLFAVRNTQKQFFPGKTSLDKKGGYNQEFKTEFAEFLTNAFETMLNEETIKHNPKAEYCQVC